MAKKNGPKIFQLFYPRDKIHNVFFKNQLFLMF
jgi:hypothetical protein